MTLTRDIRFAIFAGIVLFTAGCTAPCKKDTDCKGDRICGADGRCIYPTREDPDADASGTSPRDVETDVPHPQDAGPDSSAPVDTRIQQDDTSGDVPGDTGTADGHTRDGATDTPTDARDSSSTDSDLLPKDSTSGDADVSPDTGKDVAVDSSAHDAISDVRGDVSDSGSGIGDVSPDSNAVDGGATDASDATTSDASDAVADSRSDVADAKDSGVRDTKSPTHPQYSWKGLATGIRHACGILKSGKIKCWGHNLRKQLAIPKSVRNGLNTFLDLAGGEGHTCGVRTDHSLVCWGENKEGQSSPPGGKFREVVAGNDMSCAIRKGGQVVCWGKDIQGSWQNSTLFNEIDVTTSLQGGMCGIKKKGAGLKCFDPQGRNRKLKLPTIATRFTTLALGHTKACGVEAGSGKIVCWSQNHATGWVPIKGKFLDVAKGRGFGCGILSGSNWVACWGNSTAGRAASVPARLSNTPFKQIEAGYSFVCGITKSDEMECWGDNGQGQASPPTKKKAP